VLLYVIPYIPHTSHKPFHTTSIIDTSRITLAPQLQKQRSIFKRHRKLAGGDEASEGAAFPRIFLDRFSGILALPFGWCFAVLCVSLA
jgi:hypothetical protein